MFQSHVSICNTKKMSQSRSVLTTARCIVDIVHETAIVRYLNDNKLLPEGKLVILIKTINKCLQVLLVSDNFFQRTGFLRCSIVSSEPVDVLVHTASILPNLLY